MADKADLPEHVLRAALAASHPDDSPTAVIMRAYDALEPHPFRSPAISRNDRCLDCGSYEEDGPHLTA